ncbi:MAG: hypothetical protein KBD01_09405 [Acidobacteria bacterium]|nr:hypothetical protein [Acidobacteriota bacterium]
MLAVPRPVQLIDAALLLAGLAAAAFLLAWIASGRGNPVWLLLLPALVLLPVALVVLVDWAVPPLTVRGRDARRWRSTSSERQTGD